MACSATQFPSPPVHYHLYFDNECIFGLFFHLQKLESQSFWSLYLFIFVHLYSLSMFKSLLLLSSSHQTVDTKSYVIGGLSASSLSWKQSEDSSALQASIWWGEHCLRSRTHLTAETQFLTAHCPCSCYSVWWSLPPQRGQHWHQFLDQAQNQIPYMGCCFLPSLRVRQQWLIYPKKWNTKLTSIQYI